VTVAPVLAAWPVLRPLAALRDR